MIWGKDFKELSRDELWEQLAALEEPLSDMPGEGQIKNLVQKLRIHQVELEMQNRELHDTRDALEEARDHYSALYDFAPIGYMILDTRGIVQEINLTGAEMLGRPRAMLVDRPFIPRLAPGHSGEFLSHLNQAFGDPIKTTIELALRTRQGETPWIRLESVRVRSGRETVCRTAMINVTEQRRVEEDLRYRQQQHRRVADAVPVLIAYVDRDMRYRTVNATFQDWFGEDPARIIGHRVEELFDDATVGVLQSSAQSALVGEEVSFRGYIIHHVRGRLRVSVTLIPDGDDARPVNGYFAIVLDLPGPDPGGE